MFPCNYFARRYFPGRYFPPVCIVVTRPKVGGGGSKRRYITPDELDSVLDDIEREEEEIVAIIFAAVETGYL